MKNPDASETTAMPKKKVGGQPGNQNARREDTVENVLKTGLFAASERSKRRRRKFRRAAEAESEAILKGAGLLGVPLARRIARRMSQIECESAFLEIYSERRGRTNKDGSLKPAYSKLLELRARDLDECRGLLDQLSELAEKTPLGPVEVTIVRKSPSDSGVDTSRDVVEGTCLACAARRAESDDPEIESTETRPDPIASSGPVQSASGGELMMKKPFRRLRDKLLGRSEPPLAPAESDEPIEGSEEPPSSSDPVRRFPGSGWPSDRRPFTEEDSF